MATLKTDAFEVYGLEEQKKALDALLLSNPDMEKAVQDIIRQVLKDVRKAVSESAKATVGSGYKFSHGDPRQAYKAVRTSVYRRILGGQANILAKRRAGARKEIPTNRKPLRIGGNRRDRSGRTKDLQSYYGTDRGFVLRFINAGTSNRVIRFTPDESRTAVHRGARGGRKYGKTINTGNRGSIKARNFFASSSHKAMKDAASTFEKLVDELIRKQLS